MVPTQDSLMDLVAAAQRRIAILSDLLAYYAEMGGTTVGQYLEPTPPSGPLEA